MTWLDALTTGRTYIPEPEIALRFLLAVTFAAVIGFEREIRSQDAGLRTHMLTSLAAAIFTVLTFEIFHQIRSLEGHPNVDPIRLINAVTAGASFLAAGVIIRGGGKVQGLTTGAGIWLAAAIGVACGAGYYIISAFAVVLALLIFVVLRHFERRLLKTKDATE